MNLNYEIEIKIKFINNLTIEQCSFFTCELWTDLYIFENNLYTGGCTIENIAEFVVGSEQHDITNLRAYILSTLIPFLKSLEPPYMAKSFELYEWDYSKTDLEEPTFLETYYL